MNILITGGTGDVGRALTTRLLAKDWSVKVLGLEETSPYETASIKYAQCDIMNFEALKNCMKGCDAVVHLAALRGPTLAKNQDVFRINVAGTFNVYEAAAQLGIKRIVQASSINALGGVWGIADVSLQYLPLDEAHPRSPTDVYSFSKQMVEDIAEYYFRREGISGISLRFPWVFNTQKQAEMHQKNKEATVAALHDLLALSEADRSERLANLKAEMLAYRKTRPLEFLNKNNPPHKSKDPLWHCYMFGRFDCWAILDDRDAAQALEKSLSATYTGHHVLYVTAAQNALSFDSETLAKLFYPDVTKRSKTLTESETLLSNERAKALIGFESEFFS